MTTNDSDRLGARETILLASLAADYCSFGEIRADAESRGWTLESVVQHLQALVERSLIHVYLESAETAPTRLDAAAAKTAITDVTAWDTSAPIPYWFVATTSAEGDRLDAGGSTRGS